LVETENDGRPDHAYFFRPYCSRWLQVQRRRRWRFLQQQKAAEEFRLHATKDIAAMTLLLR
jgi:hypothetical protein